MLSLGPAQALQAILLAEVSVHSIIARKAGWGNASHLPMSPKRPWECMATWGRPRVGVRCPVFQAQGLGSHWLEASPRAVTAPLCREGTARAALHMSAPHYDSTTTTLPHHTSSRTFHPASRLYIAIPPYVLASLATTRMATATRAMICSEHGVCAHMHACAHMCMWRAQGSAHAHMRNADLCWLNQWRMQAWGSPPDLGLVSGEGGAPTEAEEAFVPSRHR